MEKPSYSQDEGSIIRGVMIQKREALKCIEREIAQLVEKMKGIEEDLVRLDASLAPHNHNLLPNEILSHIFILLAMDRGSVKFPISKSDAPPQLAISHVCSHWRKVALSTPELWNDTYLIYQTVSPNHFIRLHQRWLFRARAFPITLSILFSEPLEVDGLANALHNILSPIPVKRLSLFNVTYEIFMQLATLPEAALSGLSECDLDVAMFSPDDVNANMSGPHPLIRRLRSLACKTAFWIQDPLVSTLPWSQLRSLTVDASLDDHCLHLIIGILRQMPIIEELSITMYDIAVPEKLPVIMPSLRDLSMCLEGGVADGELDKILCSFMCPSLSELTLSTDNYNWTCETFEILKRHYNMQELRDVELRGNFVFPVCSVLCNAPMIRSLSLGWDAIMDDEAVAGISNGTLGQFLRRLEIDFACDIREVLDMVEARKNAADGMIRNGCSWREEITVLKDIVIYTRDVDSSEEYTERVLELKEAGITTHISHIE